jgi:hypothetical protein
MKYIDNILTDFMVAKNHNRLETAHLKQRNGAFDRNKKVHLKNARTAPTPMRHVRKLRW